MLKIHLNQNINCQLTKEKAFIEYSIDMNNIYKNIANKKGKILIVFDDMITDMLSNKKNLIQQQVNYLLEEEN